MAEVLLYPAPEVSLYEAFHQPPRLFPVAQLCRYPEDSRKFKSKKRHAIKIILTQQHFIRQVGAVAI